MKIFVLAVLLALTGDGFDPYGLEFSGGAARLVAQGAAETVIPLEGLDPVLLAEGREVQGDMKFTVTRGRFRYLFAGAETKARFEKEPARYEIQLGGTCARMGPSTEGNPDLFAVHKGRIYLFGSPECAKAFKAAPDNYLEPDVAAEPKAEATAEALAKGRALIEKAVEAAGGASKIDGLKSYQEKGFATRRTRDGVSEMQTSLTWVFPDRVRQERVFAPDMTLATVVTPAEAFFVMRGADSMFDEQRAHFRKQFRRNLLAVLRARRGEGFTAAAVGAGRVGESNVEQVLVNFDGVRLTLGVEASTGRVLSLSQRGRGPGGAFGEIVETFSDFRTVDGLSLPFKVSGTFNGEADPTRTYRVESLVINGEVSPALFEKPKPAAAQQ
jgi:YHS domain-containing protein